jgi:4-carboxymuconolactone decarboxylase
MSENTVPRPDILAAMPIPDEIRADMVDMITKSAGTVWQRPAIPPAQRSMMTISVLGTVGRLEELRTHINMGLDNGLSRLEICEVIMQLGVYAGMPAASAAFRIASAVFAERDA